VESEVGDGHRLILKRVIAYAISELASRNDHSVCVRKLLSLLSGPRPLSAFTSAPALFTPVAGALDLFAGGETVPFSTV
jgi:hypothetical protein